MAAELHDGIPGALNLRLYGLWPILRRQLTSGGGARYGRAAGGPVTTGDARADPRGHWAVIEPRRVLTAGRRRWPHLVNTEVSHQSAVRNRE